MKDRLDYLCRPGDKIEPSMNEVINNFNLQECISILKLFFRRKISFRNLTSEYLINHERITQVRDLISAMINSGKILEGVQDDAEYISRSSGTKIYFDNNRDVLVFEMQGERENKEWGFAQLKNIRNWIRTMITESEVDYRDAERFILERINWKNFFINSENVLIIGACQQNSKPREVTLSFGHAAEKFIKSESLESINVLKEDLTMKILDARVHRNGENRLPVTKIGKPLDNHDYTIAEQ